MSRTNPSAPFGLPARSAYGRATSFFPPTRGDLAAQAAASPSPPEPALRCPKADQGPPRGPRTPLRQPPPPPRRRSTSGAAGGGMAGSLLQQEEEDKRERASGARARRQGPLTSRSASPAAPPNVFLVAMPALQIRGRPKI
jgi:hypothetical protein